MNKFDRINEPLPTRIQVGFARMATYARAEAWEKARAVGLTPTQLDILFLLASRNQALRLTTVAEQLAITAATASDAVNSLLAKECLSKTRAMDDGRAIAIELTSSGKKLIKEFSDIDSGIGAAIASLDNKDQALLMNLMTKLIVNIQEQQELSLARMCVSCQYFEAQHSETKTPHYCHLVKAPMANCHLRLDCQEHVLEIDDKKHRNTIKIFMNS